MYFLIGADLVPTDSNIELFKKADTETLLGRELSELLYGATYKIFNLEVPLTDEATPIPKCGPNLISPRACIEGYKGMRVDALTLANNHILDQGVQGLNSTVEVTVQNPLH